MQVLAGTMPKRKKTDDDRAEDRKRSRVLDLPDMLQSLYSALQNCKAEDGHLLCESFIRTPKKSQAEYYDLITNPMDMLRIHQKIKSEEYTDLEQMTSDVALLVSNAKTYYEEDTQEYQDACNLWQGFDSAKAALLAANAKAEEQDDEDMEKGPQTPQAESSEEEHYEELFTSVMTATDAEGRCLSSMFQLLPSRAVLCSSSCAASTCTPAGPRLSLPPRGGQGGGSLQPPSYVRRAA